MDRPATKTVVDLMEMRATQDPSRAALVSPDEHAELTNADIGARTDAAARVFSDAEMMPGEKLAVMMASGARYATCMFGAWRIGAIVVPIDPMLKGPDARDVLKTSRASALAIDERRLIELRGLLGECDSLKAVFTVGSASEDPRMRDFDATLAQATESNQKIDACRTRPTDIAIESYRFHTDSLEAVPRTHEALLRDAGQMATRLALTPEDRGICSIPLGHGDGATALVAATSAGSKIVIPGRFDARRYWELVAAQRATWLALMPTQFLDLAFAGPPATDAQKTVRTVTLAGSSVTTQAREDFAGRFGVLVVAQEPT
jgi:long-chain acyl-CoA synthetase